MLENLLNGGIPCVLYLQGLGGWLLKPMKFFSLLGYEEFFLFVAPAVYWCVDAGLGLAESNTRREKFLTPGVP